MKKNMEYGTIADLYDVYVQWFMDLPYFTELTRGISGEVLELMCGTGRLSIELT